jgi:tetratricopeptide (TPR) repeat protein
MRTRILICLFAVFSIVLSDAIILDAQTEALDSLNRALDMSINDSERIKNLNLIAIELRNTDRQRATEMAEKALMLAVETDNRKGLAGALTTKGLLSEDADEFSDALNSYLEALDVYTDLKSEKDIARLRSLTGSVYKTLGNYDKAVENCLAGLRIYESLKDKDGIAQIYRIMGSIYKYKGDYEKSLFYYFSGLRLNEELGNLSGTANAYNNIGIVYVMMNDIEKALSYYHRSLDINLAQGIGNEAAINYGNIGVAYLNLGQLDSALYYISKRHSMAIQLNDKKGTAISLEAFGDYYLKTGQYDRALDCYMQALQQSRHLGILETTKNTLLSLSDVYEGIGDYKTAKSYYKSYVNLRDSLLNQETLKRIEQIEIEYQFDKERQQHQIEDQKKKIARTVIFITLIFSVLTLILFYLLQNVKLKQKNLREKALNLEKQQLQNEVSFKDKELFSKAIYLAEKNELINDITRRLNKSLTDPRARNNIIKDIIKDLKFNSNTQTWEEFEYIFLKVHPDFFSNLGKQHPDLSPNERRLCAFLRLNLSTKDISNITHQSPHTLTVARTRLRKKLGIANTGENLSAFLSQF